MFKIVSCFLLLNVVLASNFGSEQGDKNDDPDQIPVNKDAVEVKKESDPRKATMEFHKQPDDHTYTGFSFNVSSPLLNPLAILYKLFEDEFELAKGDKNDDPDQIPVNKDAVEVKKESDPRKANTESHKQPDDHTYTGFSFNVSSPLLNPLAILYKLFEDEFEPAKD